MQAIKGYKIIKKIGDGSLGEVFIGEDENLGLKIVAKLIQPASLKNPEIVNRIKKDTKIQTSLSHPNINSVFNFIIEQNNMYLILEYAAGKTLKEIIKQTGLIEEQRALNIFKQILGTVSFGHKKGIIHYNLKPCNIMLDNKDKIKILDYGVANILGRQGMIKAGIDMGTLYYLSPEQIKEETDIDQRTDIYSLGIIFFEMLTGVLPFGVNVKSSFGVMNEIVTHKILNIKELKPEISDQTAAVVMKMINKRKELRYLNCCECGGDLQLAKSKVNNKSECLSESKTIGLHAKLIIPKMVLVEAGIFNRDISNPLSAEKKMRTVSVDSFYIGKFPVTQNEWLEIIGNNPSNFIGDSLPVEQVSWNDIQTFLEKLNAKTGKKYRLPTEAEWEYAARGGKKSKGYNYSGSNNIEDVVWYSGNSNHQTHPVGTKKPNELGIFDMTGNVWEWCKDWYEDNYFKNSVHNNPKGPETGVERVLRGGSWVNYADGCRISNRSWDKPENNNNYSGFRVAMDL